MFMPFNYMGFGFGGCFGGGFYAPPCCCCNPFGFLPSFNPIISNMVIYNPFITTSLCSVPSYNYNFQTSYNYQTPDIYAFMPKIDFSQYTITTTQTSTQNISMDGFYNNLVSTISKNVLGSSQIQTTQTVGQTEKEASVYVPTEKPKDISYDAQKLETKWKNSKFAKQKDSNIKNLPSEFFQKVVDISKKINCNPDDLMAIMNSESGIKASAKNSNSTATGLIQFIESTANSLGTSCTALIGMTETQQLDYVEKYYAKWKDTLGMGDSYIDRGTLYALTYMPAKANQEVVSTKGSAAYDNNKGLDKNNDGKITKADLSARLMEFMA